jgi:mycobactin lysine-N-oxygenase
MRTGKRLVVIGAGPKAAAIAAKATALTACGFRVPEIVIIERGGIAQNWTGAVGYTTGRHQLGTPPEKDVGFPYHPSFGAAVANVVFSRFSWSAFKDGYVSDWVDRGRPQPTHGEWAEYLRWVIRRADAAVKTGEVTEIVPTRNNRWTVKYRKPNGTVDDLDADGLVITGPGSPRRVPRQPEDPRIVDGRSFWQNLDLFDSFESEDLPVCIVGSGETAAAVTVELLSRRAIEFPVPISIVNPHGMIHSRGESYFENRVFSDPNEIETLSVGDRESFIKRTDRGVFSLASLTKINQANNIFLHAGHVASIEIEDASPDPGTNLWVVTTYDETETAIPVSAVVVAMGFDPWSFTELLPFWDRRPLDREEQRAKILADIGWDLTIPRSFMGAPLHVPMLAGLAQGPGFPNLSSLGSMADRILAGYTEE